AATNVGPHSGADNAQLWKWAHSEYEAGTQHDIDGISQPEHAHCDGRVACSTEDRIDEKEHDDGGIAGEHDAGKSDSVLYHPGRTTHHREPLRSKRYSDGRKDGRYNQAQYKRLHCRSGCSIRIAFADAPGHHRRRANAESDRYRIQ